MALDSGASNRLIKGYFLYFVIFTFLVDERIFYFNQWRNLDAILLGSAY